MNFFARTLVGASALALMVGFAAQAQEKVKVAVTAIVEHPSLDAARDGVKQALIDAGYVEGETLTFEYESAQGQPATAAQIAQKFVGDAPDVIVAIATPSAQAVVAATQDIPVVFTAVTDPVGAQIVTNREAPGSNVTGISDFSPLNDHLALVKEFLPDAARLGVPFNPGEPNSVSLLAALHELAPKHGLTIVEAAAVKSSDVAGAVQSLVGNVDAIYLPTDNTVVTALESVLGVAIDAKIPVFAGDTDTVARGAIASVGFDYFQVGLETGAIVARVLKGENPGDIPVTNASGTDLVVNAGAAKSMGIDVPQAVRDRATRVID